VQADRARTDRAHSDRDRTRIIRRAPTDTPADHVSPTTLLPGAEPAPQSAPRPHTAYATATVSILSGWATAVVATDLIAGWWRTDRLFCLAVGFLTLLFATATVPGVILLLRRRDIGRWLIVFGAGVALLTFGSVFLAGARIAWPVYAIPALPLAGLVLALYPGTRRWCAAP
jgi:hypothetical protein